MNEEERQEILDFIAHFKGAEDVFLHGCCYWFAWILQERFNEHGFLVAIFHDPVEGHFVARFIPDTYWEDPNPDAPVYFFDIRGDVTHLYNEDDLENMWVMENSEPRRCARLMMSCKWFIETNSDKYPYWLKG